MIIGFGILSDMQDKIWINSNAYLIHLQEALCAKTLNFSHVMDLVTKVTNLIRGGNRSLSHRRFLAFLDEVDAVYGDLQMHTDIRWMSRGKCLERFFALRSEITVFGGQCSW